MFNNFLSFFGPVARIKHSIRAAFGNFTSKQEVTASFVAEGIKRTRRFFTSERYTALGDVTVEIGELLHDPRGYDAGMIEEFGDMSMELFLARMRAYGGIGRNTRTAMEQSPEQYVMEDSQVTLLVALLSLYYTMAYKETKLDLTEDAYDDGHLSTQLQDYFTTAPSSSDWRAEDLPDWTMYFPGSQEDAPGVPVLHFGQIADKYVSIIMMVIAGKSKTTRLAFDLAMPALATTVYVTGREPTLSRPSANVQSRDVREALDSYVRTNRLAGAFETALAIYHQLAMRPVPDTAEGLVWLKRARSVVLPKFSAFRGAYKAVLMGKPYGISAQVTASLKWWQDAGLATAVIAARYNAVSLWGRYFVEGGYYEAESDVYRLGHLEFDENPGAAYYSYAALVTGGDVYMPVPAQFGMHIAPWDASIGMRVPVNVRDVELTGYDVTTGPDGAYLEVTALPQPCSAVHVLGRMPTDGMFNVLSSRYRLEVEQLGTGWKVSNIAQAWGLGMLFRWAGYDLFVEYRGKSRRGNWASNATSIATRPFMAEGRDLQDVRIEGWAARKKTFMIIPSFAGEKTVIDVQVAVSADASIHAYGGGEVRTTGVYMPPQPSKDGVVLPEPLATTAVPVMLRARNPANPKEVGFLVTRPSTAHHPPDPVAKLVASDQPEEEIAGEGEQGGGST